MAAFIDIRLPVSIRIGMVGGAVFATDVAQVGATREVRNAQASTPRQVYTVEYVQRPDDFAALRAFHRVVKGMAHSFRFKDWADFEVEYGDGILGTGDGVTVAFQMTKRYTYSGQTADRTITKPVSGTVRVYDNAVEQMSGWTANYTTGVVTFSVAPVAAHVLTFTAEFDVPVRFTSDRFEAELSNVPSGVFEVRGLGLIEVVE